MPGSSPKQLVRYGGTVIETVEVPVLVRPVTRTEVIRSADVIVEKRDGLSSYPQIKNRHGAIATGLMTDGYWRQGRDDVEAVKQLAK